MDNSVIYWLAAANAAVWAGMGAYLVFLGLRQRTLARRLMQLGLLKHD